MLKKLTGYRKMAERVVDLAQKKLKMNKSRSVTKSLKLINYNYNFCKKKCKENGANSQMFNNIYNQDSDKLISPWSKHIDSEFLFSTITYEKLLDYLKLDISFLDLVSNAF